MVVGAPHWLIGATYGWDSHLLRNRGDTNRGNPAINNPMLISRKEPLYLCNAIVSNGVCQANKAGWGGQQETICVCTCVCACVLWCDVVG